MDTNKVLPKIGNSQRGNFIKLKNENEYKGTYFPTNFILKKDKLVTENFNPDIIQTKVNINNKKVNNEKSINNDYLDNLYELYLI